MHVRKTEMLRNTAATLVIAAGALVAPCGVSAQSPAGELQKDPVTGDIYRTYTQRVTRPVVDQRIERQEMVVHRPETVMETRPEFRTSYLPVTQMKWMPYVEGRWNPFRQPTVAYRQVPETRWEARSEVVNRTTTQTRWVAEKRTVEVPHQVVRYETTEHKGLELVARGMPQPRVGSNVAPEVAARLRPISSTDSTFTPQPVTAIASNTVGQATSEPPLRSSTQTGLRPQVLHPSNGLGTPLPQVGSTVIATTPAFTIYR